MKKIIKLTDRRPVSISLEQWPLIAEASFNEYDSEYECQANRTWRGHVAVRQHVDGRAIVYALYEYSSQFRGDRDVELFGGEVLESTAVDDIPEAVARVLGSLHVDRPEWSALKAECIAALPAEGI